MRQVHDAYLDLARTTLPAPVSGYIAKRSVQLGQRVAPGAPLMAIVPLDQVWVDANFKEPQLATMRIGQPVTLTADLYGGKCSLPRHRGRFRRGHGLGVCAPSAHRTRRVTGSRSCSVCRCASHSIRRSSPNIRCRSACRCRPRCDTHQRGGDRLPQIARASAADSTDLYKAVDQAAAKRVQDIIAANDRGAAKADAAVASRARDTPEGERCGA